MKRAPGFQLKGDRPANYERFWVPALMGACAADLVDAADVRPGDRVLDVACGTGVVAREAARRTGSAMLVAGADINGAMLEAARHFAGLRGVPAIGWYACDAASLPFEDAAFDAVVCQQGLQFMPDRRGALSEMARVLAADGRLAVSAWKSASPFGIALRGALDRRFGEGATAPWQAATSLGDRHELRALAEHAGFRRCHVRFDVKIGRHPDPPAFVSGVIAATPLSDAVAGLASEERASLIREITDALADHMDDGGLAYPGECHTLTARAPA